MQLLLFPLSPFYHTSFKIDSDEWFKLTGTRLHKDGQITAMTGKVFVDVFRIDKDLKNNFGPEYPEDMSMNKFVRSKFGDDASFILNKWIRV